MQLCQVTRTLNIHITIKPEEDNNRADNISEHRDMRYVNTSRYVRRQHDTSRISLRIRHASKSLLSDDRSVNLTFRTLWNVAFRTIFHLPAHMISSNFEAACGFVSPSAICLSEFIQPVYMNPCSNRCLIAVTPIAVLRSAKFTC